MITPWTIFEYLMSCFDYTFFLLIPVFQLGLHDHIKRWYVAIFILVVSLLVTIYNYSTFNSVSVIYISIMIIVVFVLLFNKGRIIAKLFWMFFPISFMYFLELLVIDILVDVYSIPTGAIAGSNRYRLIFILITKLCYILIFYLAYRFKIKINKDSSFLILMFIMCLLFLPIYELLGKHIWQFGVFFLLFSILSIIYAIKTDIKYKYEMKIQQIELKKQNSLESLALREYIDKFQGDVNASIQMIWSLAKVHDIPEIDRYMRQFTKINRRFDNLYDTGNDFLDMVLSLKDAVARKRDIQLETYIITPLDETINYTDVGNILIHLLDNAIEAVDQILYDDEGDRTIKLNMETDKNELIMKLENPTDDIPVPHLNTLLSNESEGLGLKAVEEIVDKSNGSLNIEHSDNVFTVIVKLPL